jgi:hypothetical protein
MCNWNAKAKTVFYPLNAFVQALTGTCDWVKTHVHEVHCAKAPNSKKRLK